MEIFVTYTNHLQLLDTTYNIKVCSTISRVSYLNKHVVNITIKFIYYCPLDTQALTYNALYFISKP